MRNMRMILLRRRLSTIILLFISWPLIIMFVMMLLLLDVGILFRLLRPHFFIILPRRSAISLLFDIKLILMMI